MDGAVVGATSEAHDVILRWWRRRRAAIIGRMGSAATERQRALLRHGDLRVVATACSSMLEATTEHGPGLVSEALHELDDERSEVIVWTIRDVWQKRPHEIRRRFANVASDSQSAAGRGALDVLEWLCDPEPASRTVVTTDATPPSDVIIHHRCRNQTIAYFELAASFEDQRVYQSGITYVHVPHEVINQWEDCTGGDPRSSDFDPVVYSLDEVDAIMMFHRVWEDVVQTTPEPLPSIRAVQKLAPWKALRSAATDALVVFNHRGQTEEGK